MKPVLRASYTYLNMWASGNWEQAIKAYFKIDKFVTREMAEGLDYHDEWEAETKKTGCLPAVFGGAKLAAPICEEKVVIPVYDWLNLVVKLDCYDSPTVHEYKTGTMESSDYARTKQPSIYALGMTMLKRPVRHIDIHQYNQYTKVATFSRIEATPRLVMEGMEWVETIGSEMHTYFVQNDLYNRYGKN